MFPDTANFSDPSYTNFGTEDYTGGAIPASTGSTAIDMYGTEDYTGGTLPSTGGAAVNTPAQGGSTGSSLLGWLGLASNVANTAVNASRSGYTTRPGIVKQKSSSLGSFGSMTATTLLIVVAVFIGAIFLLRKK